MGYAKIDHSILTDEKTFDLSDLALALLLRLIVWASREESDGYIPTKVVRKLGKPRAIVELILVGICTEVEQKLFVNSYLKYNSSKADIEAKRAGGRARISALRKRKEGGVTAYPSTENRVQSTEYREQRPKGFDSGEATSAKPPARRKPRLSKSPKWTVVPDDWQPKQSHIDKCKELRLDLNAQVSEYRLWEFKAPKTDADRAFSRWIGESAKRRLQVVPSYGGGSRVQVDPPKTKRDIKRDEEIKASMEEHLKRQAKSGSRQP